MWPWEHVAFGYVVYSLLVHLGYRDSPGESEAVTVAFASVLPDLIDKPLAWQFGIFESGYALGHSIFFAGPLSLAAIVLARASGRTRVGLAFAVGYMLHLVGDVIPIYVARGTWSVNHLLWPVVVVENPRGHDGLLAGFVHNFEPYVAQLLAGEVTPYIALQVGLGLAAVGLWLFDGAPGVKAVRACVGRTVGLVRVVR